MKVFVFTSSVLILLSTQLMANDEPVASFYASKTFVGETFHLYKNETGNYRVRHQIHGSGVPVTATYEYPATEVSSHRFEFTNNAHNFAMSLPRPSNQPLRLFMDGYQISGYQVPSLTK